MQDYGVFIHLLTQGLQLSKPIEIEFEAMLNPLTPRAFCSHYLAYLAGKPVGTLTAFIHDKVVGLYCLTTADGARRQGVGTALLHQALQDAKAKGCQQAIGHLPVSEETVSRLLRKCGFKTVCHFTPYIHGVFTPAI